MPTRRGGESFDTMLNPTGLRQSSPVICRKYNAMSHIGLTRMCVDSKMRAAGMMMANEKLSRKRLSVNFTGLDGSCLPSLIHSHAKTGEKMMMKSGSTDWNQLDGSLTPK